MDDWINSKPLDQIAWADIESLIGNVSESESWLGLFEQSATVL